jgi:hypothetical protein
VHKDGDGQARRAGRRWRSADRESGERRNEAAACWRSLIRTSTPSTGGLEEASRRHGMTGRPQPQGSRTWDGRGRSGRAPAVRPMVKRASVGLFVYPGSLNFAPHPKPTHIHCKTSLFF